MAKISTFSDEIMRELLAMLRWWRARPQNIATSQEYELAIAPDDLVALTGNDGIAGRSGTTISSELCIMYRTAGTIGSGAMTLQKMTNGDGSDLTQYVYNISDTAVGANKYVVTTRLRSGLRYVVLESCT
jgi:hypothetical protein